MGYAGCPIHEGKALPSDSKILFEDTHLIVLSKPAGLLSQGDHSGEDNLVDWLRRYLGRNYVGLVHRLDRNVSGIMVVAKRSKSARRLTESLQKGDLKRWYQGWVVGRLTQQTVWKHYLKKDEKTNRTHVVRDGSAGQIAILQATPIREKNVSGHVLTLVEFELQTGRSHQIRAQCAAEKLPLLGDPKYGKPQTGLSLISRPALHSIRISFPHPMDEKNILSFEDELPEDFKHI